MKSKKFILMLSTITAIGLVSITTISACSSVSQSVKDNFVDKDADTLATWANNGKLSLSEQIKKILSDSTANDAAKTSVVNSLLVKWYTNEKTKSKDWQDTYDKWVADIKDDYKAKIKDYKSKHHGDWVYYFQNEVLDPVGGTEDLWKANELATKIRSDFDSKVFANSFLGMATEDGIRKTETDYNPENSITKSLTAKELISNDIGTATNATDMPNRWSSIDFYGATVTTADDFSKSLNNMYADLQHYAFNMYTERNHIINTSMILWKYNNPESGLGGIYNADAVKDLPSTANYQFPYFYDANGTDGPNTKFHNFVTGQNGNYEGIYDTSATPALNRSPYGAWDGTTTSKAGVITFPKTLGDDDGGTLFKLNLSKCGADSINVTYANAAADLWNSYNPSYSTKTVNKQTDLPYGRIQKKFNTQDSSNNIMDNFFFNSLAKTATGAKDSLQDITLNTSDSYSGGVNDYKGTDLNDKYSQIGTKGLSLFNSASTNEDLNKWYQDYYRYSIPGFQLGYGSEGNSAATFNPLPLIFVREEPGIHVIGLDGAGYLSVSKNTYTGILGTPFSQEREDAILKMRCLESNLGGFAQDSTSFDFTKSGGDLNTFFTSNENEILLQMAEKAIDDNANGDNAPTDKKNNIFYDIFGPSTDLKTDVFTNFYNTVEALQAITMWQTAITDLNSSNAAVLKFPATFNTNEKTGYYLSPNNDANGKPKYLDTRYSNGLATNYPWEITSATVTTYNDDTQINAMSVGNDLMSTTITSSVKNAITSKIYDTFDGKMDSLYSNFDDCVSAINGLIKADTDKSGNRQWSENAIVDPIDAKNAWLANGVNAAINSFAGSNSWSNIIKNIAYDQYANKFTNDQDILATNYKDAIDSEYNAPKVITADKTLASYDTKDFATANNDASTQDVKNNLDNLHTVLDNQQKIAAAHSTSMKYNYDNDDSLNKLQASIYYSTHNASDGVDYTVFLQWLKNKLGIGYNSAYIAWVARGSINNDQKDTGFNFSKLELNGDDSVDDNVSSIQSIYGFRDNYNGEYVSDYSNLTDGSNPISTIDSTESVTNDKYYQHAKSSFNVYYKSVNTTPAGWTSEDMNLNGYYGLQTESSCTLPGNVKTALFDKWSESNPSLDTNPTNSDSHEPTDPTLHGALYKYASQTGVEPFGTITSSDKNDLVNYIFSLTNPNDVDSLSAQFSTALGNKWLGQADLINNVATIFPGEDQLLAKKEILVSALYGYGVPVGTTSSNSDQSPDWNNKPSWFSDAWSGNEGLWAKYVSDCAFDQEHRTEFGTPYQIGSCGDNFQEICNPEYTNVSHVISDDSNGTALSGAASRTMILQLNRKLDVDTITNVTDKDALNDLKSKLGDGVVNDLIVQCALDSSTQTQMVETIIKSVFGGKITVYDRRLNDQLGKLWVENFKNKN